jgi:hypothetical protein
VWGKVKEGVGEGGGEGGRVGALTYATLCTLYETLLPYTTYTLCRHYADTMLKPC